MKNSGKKILMACGNYWYSPFQVGSHHIARGFAAKGWEVAYLSDPISPLHLLGGNSSDLSVRYDLYRSGGRSEEEGHIWTYVPGALLTPHNKPILRSRSVHRHWDQLTLPRLKSVLTCNGFDKVDLLYFDTPNYLCMSTLIEYKKAIFRVADRFIGFSKCTQAMKEMEKELVEKVDYVVYTARALEEYVKEMHPQNSFHLPNGVNFKHFVEEREIPDEYVNIPKPIAVYVGAMDQWFDYRLVNEVAKRMPEVSFVFIGPDKLARERIEKRKNVYVLGARSYSIIPAYLKYADVGLIPFDVEGHSTLVNSIHPLKLYEYMACGLPVVSVDWEELHTIHAPAFLATGVEAFCKGIRQAVCCGMEKRKNYIEFARAQDWENRVEDILNLIIL